MTYGGKTEDTWTLQKITSDRGWINSSAATVTENVPTAGTYMTFTPTANGRLTMSWYAFGNGSITLSDGTNIESLDATSGNGTKTASFATILETGKTYYVYCSAINTYTNGFWGFTYDIAPITVSASIAPSSYTAFSSAYPLDFSNVDGIYAYYVESEDIAGNQNVTLKKIEGTVAANTGLVLNGTAGETYNIPVVASGNDVTGNLLRASVTATEIDNSFADGYGNVYVLSSGQFVGITDYVDANTSLTIPAGKSYLVASQTQVKALNAFINGEATGISTAVEDNVSFDGATYNLAGQRVDASYKGIVIRNGKKFLVK